MDKDNSTRQNRHVSIAADSKFYENGDGDDQDVQLRHRNGIVTESPVSHRTVEGHNSTMEENMEVYDQNLSDLLQQLPSRQLEDVADMAARTLLRKRGTHLLRTSMRINTDNALEDRIVESLEQESSEDLADDIDAAVRNIPTTLTKKRSIKHRLSIKASRPLSRWKLIKYTASLTWRHVKFEMKKIHRLFDLWRSHLLVIEGCFGTSVASYFIFLKWVLLINIPIFLLTFTFLVIPQILYSHYVDKHSSELRKPFTGVELLTGTGAFENSEMYYGFYTNMTIEISKGANYNMKYAYILTTGGYYLFCLIILGYSYLRSYRLYYIEASGSTSMYYFNLIYTGWDYGITSVETGQLKQRSIYNEIKEFLAGKSFNSFIKEDMVTTWLKRLLSWLFVCCLLALSGYTTFVVSTELSLTSERSNSTSIPALRPLAMPVVLSSIQLFVPMIFTFLEGKENYQLPKYELYIHMFREMALKATMLCVLVYFWLQEASKELKCWETFVGEEIYRLVIVDFIFNMGYTFFMEFIRKLISLKWERIKKSEFAIGRHTLELVYSQTLCWLGVFYSPLLPVVVILKLIIIFYVKRYSVVHNCSPSVKPWKASRTHTIFVGYLFVFFILCSVAVGCSIFLVTPSHTCGPYQNYSSSYEVINSLITNWEDESSVIKEIFNFVDSPGFIAGLLIFLLMVLYYARTISLSHKAMVEQFKLQLISEGKDKKFLINLLNQVKIRGRKSGINHPGPLLQKKIELLETHSNLSSLTPDSVPSSTKLAGKVFVRTVAENYMGGSSMLL
ncbi:transmembrane channel-like protein 5 isoform X2 [Physella acuta]|uniref:transmembrane channel-like protein 5 isoform X2 n=1 Tax=Physella acuta TaxID=109671 RepID=UPI0027DC86DA|nr:transmembrane channel-like protein 5 isoform X2 [Physella acuta]